MTARGKLWMAVLWPGIWGAIMVPAGAGNLIARRLSAGHVFDMAWMEPLAWSYLFIGPVVVLAAFRLHEGRRWPRLPLQGFLLLMLAGLACMPFVMYPLAARLFDGFEGEGGPPAFFRIFFYLILALQFAMLLAFAGCTVWAFRCLRSEEVRSLASGRGF